SDLRGMASATRSPGRTFLLCRIGHSHFATTYPLGRVSRQSEKFLIEQSRKFLLTAENWKDGTNRNEPGGTRLAGMVEAGQGRCHDAGAGGGEDGRKRPLGAKAAEAHGDGVVVHGLRGRSSNRQIDAQTQERAIVLLKQPEWHDFGPTFASEQLAKRHDIGVSKETVRGWMVAAGLWKSQPRKLGEKHFWRARRSGYGELVQWDTSNHDWLEGRGEAVRYLVKWIDDATSRSGGRFVLHDGTRENMGVLWQYAEGNGRMVDLYSDR